MNTKEIKKLIEEKNDLAQRAYEAYQQLQGQLSLLRDMYKSEQVNEQKKLKDSEPKEPTNEEKK